MGAPSGKDPVAAGVWADMSPWLSDRFLSSQSDERLAALASAGSERAFAAIVQRYRRPLLAFARRLSPTGEAEDLVQQAFMSALAAMRTGVEVRHLRGWLHQILRHAAIQASKRALVPAELEHADVVTPSAQQAAEIRMLTAEALAALAQLPARQHEAMVATAIHGQSRAEVAQLLGLSEGAVRQLVHRAREALRTAVTAITPYPLAQALAAGSPGGGIADVVAGAGAGSAGALAVKIGAVVASGVVATGIVTTSVNGRHSAHRSQGNVIARSAPAPDPPLHDGAGTRIAGLAGGSSAENRLTSEESGRGRGGGPGSSSGDGRDGSPGTSSDGSSGGPSPSSGSSDGGGSNSGSPGGPSATTATTASSSDGGMTTTTTTSGSDGGGPGPSGGSGSSDGGTTTSITTTTATSGSDGGTTSGGH